MTPVQVLFGAIIIGAALAVLAMFRRSYREEQRRRKARLDLFLDDIDRRGQTKVVDHGNGMTELVQSDTISLEEWRRKTGITGQMSPTGRLQWNEPPPFQNLPPLKDRR